MTIQQDATYFAVAAIADEATYKDLREKMLGSEYEAAAALGTLHMLDSAEANNKLNELCTLRSHPGG